MKIIKYTIQKLRINPIMVLILVSLCLRAGMAVYLGDTLEGSQQVRIFDQHSYDLLARSLLAGRGYSFEQNWYPFTLANTPTAHWSFLYPIFLASIYAITGFHPLAARLIQAVICSILFTLLLYRLGCWLSGEVVGLVTAGLGAIYSYFILYNAALMTESFFILGVLIMFILSLKIMGEWNSKSIDQDYSTPTMRSHSLKNRLFNKQISLWILLGIDLGISALLRQTILLWVPFLFTYLIFYPIISQPKKAMHVSTNNSLKTPRIKTRFVGAFVSLIVLFLFILPFTIRNYIVYGAFLPLNSNAGYAFYSSNYPAQGTHFDQDYVAPLPQGTVLGNEAHLSAQLTRLGLEFILSDPKRFLLLSLNRVGVFFNFGFRSDSSLQNNLIRTLSTGLYLPLFLLGIWFSRHDFHRYILFYLFAVIFSLIHIFSWAGIRYRLPIDAVFMPFAALSVAHIAKYIPVKWISLFFEETRPEQINYLNE
jgi:hypothetical protein